MKPWQENMLENLTLYFEPNANILGLLLFGSYIQPGYPSDDWSDIDILVVVRDDELKNFFPSVEWLKPLGKIYTFSQPSDNYTCTTRICFEDFSRIDLVITTEANLTEISKWSSIPFFSGSKVLFSRSPVVDNIATKRFSKQDNPSVTQEQFNEIVRNFRFKSMLAVYKVVRGDLLIALHLSQDLIRDCSVLGMILRDRATGTNIHKHGGTGNKLVSQLEVTQKPFSPLGILDSIKESNIIFERLACEWSNSYQEYRQPLLDWIEKAKAEVKLVKQ